MVLLGLALAACTARPTIPSGPTGPLVSGAPQSASSEGGTFRLTITSDQDRYRAGQLIVVSAALTYLGPADQVTVSGSGSLVGFGVASSDGRIDVEPLFTGDCAPYAFTRDEPVPFAFVKSGSGFSGPQAPFLKDYSASPDLRLPGGTWTIKAETTIYPGPMCPAGPDDLTALLTVVVEP
jgi:hypothetical protein